MDSSDEKSAHTDILEVSRASDLVDPHRVLRKLDWRLIPFVSVLYLLAYMSVSPSVRLK